MIHGVAGLWAQSFSLCIHHSLSPSPTHTLCPVHGHIPSPSHTQSFSLCIHQSVTHSKTLPCPWTQPLTKSHTMLQSLHPSVSQSVSHTHTHTVLSMDTSLHPVIHNASISLCIHQSVNHLHTLSCPWAHPFVNHTQPFSLCILHSLTHCPVLSVDTSLHQVTNNPSICTHQVVIHSHTLSCPWTHPFTKAHRMTPRRQEDRQEHEELNTCKLCGFTDTGLGAGLPDAKFRKTSSQAVTSIFVPHVTISFSIIGPEHTPSLILNNSLSGVITGVSFEQPQWGYHWCQF